MLSAEGECSTGASIGPICSSIWRVSWNGSRNGISSQRRRGLPMSTVKLVAPTRDTGRRPARVSRSRPSLSAGRAMTGSLVIAQATQRVPLPQAAGLRAVGVVDAQVGVGAGRDADRGPPSAGRSATAARPRSPGPPRRQAASPVPRRSTITISLPRPFIFRKRRFASALTAGSDVVLEEGVDFAAIWAESTAFASRVASRLGNGPMVETPGPEPDSRLSR